MTLRGLFDVVRGHPSGDPNKIKDCGCSRVPERLLDPAMAQLASKDGKRAGQGQRMEPLPVAQL